MKSKNKMLAVIISSLIIIAGITAGIIIYIESQPNKSSSVNTPPVIDKFYPLGNPIIFEMQVQTFNVSASDSNGDFLIYSWYLNDSIVKGNFTSYTFTSDYISSGIYGIRAEVTDGEFVCNHTWTLTVCDVNRPPLFSELPDQQLAEDSQKLDALDLDDYISDPDGDVINFTISENTNPNCGVSLDMDNTIDIIPISNWNGISNITIQATDGKDYSFTMFQVNVTPVNDPFIIEDYYPSYHPKINETQSQKFNITIGNPDNTILTYSWTLNDTSVGSNSTSYTFNANYNSNGTYIVKIIATDGEDTVEHNWTLTVSNINRAPTIDDFYPTSNPTINETQSQEFNITVTDPDNDPITYAWFIDRALVGGNQDTYTHNTNYDSAGIYTIKVNATDGEVIIEKMWTLTVINVNRAPEITYIYPAISSPEINENENQDFNITARDLDDDPLTIRWYVDGGLVQIGGNYTFTTDYDFAGVYTVKVNVTDGELVDNNLWTLTVIDVNRAPEITYIFPTNSTPKINENESQDFNITVRDLDGDPLTVRWYVDGSLVQIGGNYSFATNYDSEGVYIVKVNVTDGELVDDNLWTLTVNKMNRAPIADIVNEDVVSNVGWFVKFNGSNSYDPDGNEDIDTYLWDFGDGTFGTGKLINHLYSSLGDYIVKLTVNDTYGEQNYDEINVSVQDLVEEEINPYGLGMYGHYNREYAMLIDRENKTPLYLNSVTIYIDKVGSPSQINITLNVRGVSWDSNLGIDGLWVPNNTYYYRIIQTINNSLGDQYVTIPINNDFFISSKAYIVTSLEGGDEFDHYKLIYCDGIKTTFLSRNTGGWMYHDGKNQIMNITYLWANTTSDVNSPPQARIVNDDVVSNIDWKVIFGGSDSWDANGLNDIDKYSWNFGDGSYGFGREINHTYTVAGKYKAILTVNDSFNVKSSDWVWVTVQDYQEIEIEPDNSNYFGYTDSIVPYAQLLDLSYSFYLYYVIIYIREVNQGAGNVFGNLTIELQGVNGFNQPNGSIFFSNKIFNISEGWINIPIDEYLVKSKIHIVLEIEQYITAFAYFSFGHSDDNSENTYYKPASSWNVVAYDLAMNVTIQWTNTTSDVVKNNFNLSIPSFIPLTLIDYNSTLYILVYVLGFTESLVVSKHFKRPQNKTIKLGLNRM